MEIATAPYFSKTKFVWGLRFSLGFKPVIHPCLDKATPIIRAIKIGRKLGIATRRADFPGRIDWLFALRSAITAAIPMQIQIIPKPMKIA